jgi:hypothetical protein
MESGDENLMDLLVSVDTHGKLGEQYPQRNSNDFSLATTPCRHGVHQDVFGGVSQVYEWGTIA